MLTVPRRARRQGLNREVVERITSNIRIGDLERTQGKILISGQMQSYGGWRKGTMTLGRGMA